jgi:hypothetical protein
MKQERRCRMNYMVYLALKGLQEHSEVNFHLDDQLLSRWLTITKKRVGYSSPRCLEHPYSHLLQTAPLILSSSFFLSFFLLFLFPLHCYGSSKQKFTLHLQRFAAVTLLHTPHILYSAHFALSHF